MITPHDCYEAQTLLRLDVSHVRHASVYDTNTYDYIESYHFLKLLSIMIHNLYILLIKYTKLYDLCDKFIHNM
jgi:hypothetical protein